VLAEAIHRWSEARALDDAKPGGVRAYNAGRCVRELWYGEHGYQPLPRDGRSVLVFDLGTRIEAAVLWILEAELGADFRRATRDDRVRLEPLGNVCADGFVRVDGKWRPVDVKSAAPMGFERAEVGDLDGVYLAQGECYCRAYDADVCTFLFYDKATSQLAEIEVERDDERWARILADVRAARAGACPDRPYALEELCSGCDGTGKTPKRGQAHKACNGTGRLEGGPFIPTFPCNYCSFRDECWGELVEVECNGKRRLRPAKGDTP